MNVNIDDFWDWQLLLETLFQYLRFTWFQLIEVTHSKAMKIHVTCLISKIAFYRMRFKMTHSITFQFQRSLLFIVYHEWYFLSLCVYNVHRPYGNFVYIIILAKKSIFNSNSILYRTWSVRVYDQKVVRRTHSSTFKRKVISFSLITLDSLESLVRAFWIKMLRLH